MMLSSFVVISWSFLIAITTTKAQNLNTITSSSRTRSYWVHPPDEYDPTQSQTYPVVIAFHGSSEIGYDVDGFALEVDIRLSLPLVSTKYSPGVSNFIYLFVCFLLLLAISIPRLIFLPSFPSLTLSTKS